MIYFISDLHGGEDVQGFNDYLDVARDSDILIILGDLGLNFKDTPQNRSFTEFFLSTSKQIAIVDGNHENHSYMRSFPEDVMYNAPVYRLTDNIVYFKRGEIYTIEDSTFFVMGGCKSSQKWYDAELAYEFEDPSDAEVNFAVNNLARHSNKVDYILTHKYKKGETSPLQRLTDYIDENVCFKHWFSGHWHKNEKLDDKHTVIYNEATALH